jgi:hypothetical protein
MQLPAELLVLYVPPENTQIFKARHRVVTYVQPERIQTRVRLRVQLVTLERFPRLVHLLVLHVPLERIQPQVQLVV